MAICQSLQRVTYSLLGSYKTEHLLLFDKFRFLHMFENKNKITIFVYINLKIKIISISKYRITSVNLYIQQTIHEEQGKCSTKIAKTSSTTYDKYNNIHGI